MRLPQVIKSFQNYRGVATTFYPTLVSVSFLKGKLLGFIYWKRVKIVPANDTQTYRANGGISPPILNVGTSSVVW
jgi:hypothetical protein